MARQKKIVDFTRVTFSFRKTVKDRIVRLVDIMEADTMVEVVRRSVILAESLYALKKRGVKFFYRTEEGEEIRFDFF